MELPLEMYIISASKFLLKRMLLKCVGIRPLRSHQTYHQFGTLLLSLNCVPIRDEWPIPGQCEWALPQQMSLYYFCCLKGRVCDGRGEHTKLCHKSNAFHTIHACLKIFLVTCSSTIAQIYKCATLSLYTDEQKDSRRKQPQQTCVQGSHTSWKTCNFRNKPCVGILTLSSISAPLTYHCRHHHHFHCH